MDEANSIINVQNIRSFLNNCPISNPKLPLESSESQLFPPNARCDLANTPGALIRQNRQIICALWAPMKLCLDLILRWSCRTYGGPGGTPYLNILLQGHGPPHIIFKKKCLPFFGLKVL